MSFQLIYTCATAQSATCEDVTNHIEALLMSLTQGNITGVLMCKEGSILQVLEGEENAVMTLYKSTVSDSRVLNPLVLIKRETTRPEFKNWSMGYKNATKTETTFNLCPNSFADAFPKNISAELETVSRTFARVNGLIL